jgi:glycosyltransferase involved in cell wall biosynthesis
VGSSGKRLLVFSASHLIKISFGIIFDQLYRTGRLQQSFELHHYTGFVDRDVDEARRPTVDGVRLHRADSKTAARDTDRIQTLLSDLQPDVVLLLSAIAHFRPLVSALRQWPGPIAGWFPVEFERDTNPYQWSAVLDCCDRIIAQAEFGRRQLRRTGAEIGLVGLGVNLAVFRPADEPTKIALRGELGWARDGFVFLYVGRNDPRKGVELAVEAFRIYCQRDPEAGRRSYLYLHTQANRSLLELIHFSGLTDRVWVTSGDYHLLRNPLPETKLAKLYQAADAFLLPSNGEGFGMPLLEAQAVGLPVIATDSSAITEVVGDAGLLINAPVRTTAFDGDCIVWARPPDLDHAADLMRTLYHDPALRDRLSRNGQRQAATRSWDVIAEELLGELLPLVNSSASALTASN